MASIASLGQVSSTSVRGPLSAIPHRRLRHLLFALAGVVTLGGVVTDGDAAARIETTRPAAAIPAARGDSLGGLVLPVEARDGDITIRSLRGWTWRVGTTQRLLLQGDARIEIAGWVFEGPRLVLWIERIPSKDGLVTQIALWIPEATSHTSGVGRGPSGKNLLVVATVRGETVLDTALLEPGPPPGLDSLVQQANNRLAGYVHKLQKQPPPLVNYPVVVGEEKEPEAFVPVPGASLPAAFIAPSTQKPTLSRRWLQQPGATIAFSADHVTIDAGETESTVLIDGDVVVHYRPARRTDEMGALRLSAERAVLYANPGSIADAAGSMSADDVRGIYLEGAVIAESDRNDYVVRATRMYYDFITDRAIMLDAVLRTYDRERRVPVYARAEELRQLSDDQWSGTGVRLSASSFATPTLSIGCDTATIKQVPGTILEDGTQTETRIQVTGIHNTIRAGSVPFFYWPWFKGYADGMPLRSVSTGFEKYQGVGIEARWDLAALLGLEPMAEDDLELETAGYTKRGVALGFKWKWNRPGDNGNLSMWGLHDDTNTEERLSTGITQQVPKTWRGYLDFADQLKLGNDWQLNSQISWISDSTFMSSWRQTDFDNRREYETSLYLKRDRGNSSLSVLMDYSLNSFVSNSWLLASQGFMLDEFPKATYRRFGDDIFDTLTYSGDISFSRFKAVIPGGTAADNGINTNVFAGPGVAFGPADDIAFALAQRGIDNEWHTRVNSMSHVTMPLAYGPVQITPFASAQLQGFLQEESAATEGENLRALGGIGIHATTTFQRVYNDAHNDTLGINRMRILLDPWVKGWVSGANFNPIDEPNYDPLVDATGRGAAVEVGLRHRIQTQRGGPGRWYDADWLTTRVSATLSTEDSTRRWFTPRFYDSNPLMSSFGNYANGSLDFRPAEAVQLTGEGTWDLDLNGFTRAAIAVNFDHTPRLSSGIAYRYFEVPEDYAALFPNQVKNARGELLDFPLRYEVSKSYSFSISPQYNFSEDDFQSVSAVITRKLPDFDLVFYVSYDQILDETVGGIRLGQTRF
ncbi:MAG: hypothetical protein P8M32_02250 [Phycisphaerales bacterium]|nr:hypothetical protein [Phycisphaerales bacterium]